MKKIILLVASLLLFAPLVFAQDARVDTIKKIVEAQGLKEMFDDSLAQSREGAVKLGADMYKNYVASGLAVENARHKKAYDDYMRAIGALFSSDEIVAQWSAAYGKDLSLAELRAILAYYQSPTGRKDVAATKVATQQIMGWLGAQTQSRLQPLIEALTRQLSDADKPCENGTKSAASGTSECA